MRRRVIVDLASAGPLEVKFIIALRRSTPVIEYRRFELGPPGESKLPLSNREYTDFLKILNNKIFYKANSFKEWNSENEILVSIISLVKSHSGFL